MNEQNSLRDEANTLIERIRNLDIEIDKLKKASHEFHDAQAVDRIISHPSSPRSNGPDRFMLMEPLTACLSFHQSDQTAQYNFEELLSLGHTRIEKAMYSFSSLTAHSSVAIEEATFSLCYDYFMDLVRVDSICTPSFYSTPTGLNPSESLARELLIQAIASRRPSVKLAKIAAAIRVLSEPGTILDHSISTDDLLETLARLIPSIPMLRETVTVLRHFLNHQDSSVSVGPIGYALTTLEAVLGSL